MKPINFPEANQVFHKPESMTDEECVSLPVCNDGTQLASCWEMSAEEKLKAVFFGKLWISIIGQSRPPMWMMIDNTAFSGADAAANDNGAFLEYFKTRKIRQFLSQRYVDKDLDSGIMIDDSDTIKNLLLDFINFLFQEQEENR